MKLVKQSHGADLMLGIEGSLEEAQAIYQSLINRGVIPTLYSAYLSETIPLWSLHSESDSFHYIRLQGSAEQTATDKLKAYFRKIVEWGFDIDRIITERTQAFIDAKASRLFEAIASERFLSPQRVSWDGYFTPYEKE